MDTSNTFVKKIRAQYGNVTDYRLAKMLKMSPQGIHSWKSRGSVFDDKVGIQIAALLNLDPAYVLSCLAVERSKDPAVRKTYERVAMVFDFVAHIPVSPS